MKILKRLVKILIRLVLFSILIILILVGLFKFVIDHEFAEKYGFSHIYEELMTVEEIERIKPEMFLKTNGTYRENLWGDKIIINGSIENISSDIDLKNATIKIVFYSKTGAIIKTERHVIYDYFPSRTVKKFLLKVPTENNVRKIGWEVVNAEID